MNIVELSKIRESVRDYQDRAVEEEKLNIVMEAARLAPSACNRQPWKFFILKSEEAKNKAAECYSRDWIRTAPLIIMCCIDHSQEWIRSRDGKRHGDIDIAIAVEHICLAAAEQGLGTCWICHFDAQKCKEYFGLQDNIEVAALIPIGYSTADAPREKTRKDITEIVEIL